MRGGNSGPGWDGPQPVTIQYASQDSQAENMADNGDPAGAASRYAQLANTVSADIRHDYLLRATELWLIANNPAQARITLNGLAQSDLTGDNRYQFKILSAEVSLSEGLPNNAYSRLDENLNIWPASQRQQALKLRGQAALRDNRIQQGISDFIKRNGLLNSSEQRDSEELLWNELLSVQFASGMPPTDNPLIQGWIDLAKVGQSQWLEPNALNSRISNWQDRYPRHPGNNAIVAQMLSPNGNTINGAFATQVALLLPVTGRYQNAGEAIRNGFMSSWFADSGNFERPEVRVYDTKGTPSGAIAAYEKAVKEGNTLAVGPLLRSSVDAVVNSSDSFGGNVVPLLTLNQASYPELYRRANLLQFSLDPADETRDAAERIFKLGYTRGLIFIPDTEFGRQQYEVFRERTESLGGAIVDTEFYNPEDTDFRKRLKQMTAFTASKSRRSDLNSTLGIRVAYEPRSEGDAGYLFMIAKPSHGRLIKPQLKYIRAGNIPIFATSLVYSGKQDQIADRDMNGIQFNSTPWTLEARPELAGLRATFKKNWPKQYFRNHKLYPLGVDAYYLIPAVYGNIDLDTWSINGASGRLSVGERRSVKRELAWAQFDNGLPRIINSLDEIQATEFEDFGPREDQF